MVVALNVQNKLNILGGKHKVSAKVITDLAGPSVTPALTVRCEYMPMGCVHMLMVARCIQDLPMPLGCVHMLMVARCIQDLPMPLGCVHTSNGSEVHTRLAYAIGSEVCSQSLLLGLRVVVFLPLCKLFTANVVYFQLNQECFYLHLLLMLFSLCFHGNRITVIVHVGCENLKNTCELVSC